MNKKKGCLIVLLIILVILVAIGITLGVLINDYEKPSSEQKFSVDTETGAENTDTKYNIEDISKGKYYVFDNEYEKLYEKACNAALAWVDMYDEYKPIEDSRLTIFDDGSVAMQITSLDDKGVTVTYTAKDKNGDRERISIMYDTENGVETITEK